MCNGKVTDTQTPKTKNTNSAVKGSCPVGSLAVTSPPLFNLIMAIIPDGCILVARKVKESGIWNKPSWWWKVFSYLIMEVSYKDSKNVRGTGFFQYKEIFRDCKLHREKPKLNYKSIDNVIRWMRKEAICTTELTTRGIHITLCKYKHYQNIDNYRNDKLNDIATTKQRRSNDTITKECNKVKNVIKREPFPPLETILEYFKELKQIGEAEKFFDYYQSNGWKVGKNIMKDWKAAARNWCKRNFGKNEGGIDKWLQKKQSQKG